MKTDTESLNRLTNIKSEVSCHYLIKKNGPVSINELQKNVWSYQSDIETHTVETHIYRLREKLKPKASKFISIKTSKDGYSVVLQAGN